MSFIQIPSEYRSTMTAVMDSLGGENYNYYQGTDVTKVEPSNSRAKIKIALKVLVPKAQRSTAAEEIQLALSRQQDINGEVIEGRNGKQLNVPVEGGVIRIDIKPESGGSGAGTEVTRISESTQCLYLALRYHVYNKDVVNGTKGVISTKEYEEALKYCDVSAKLEEMITLGGGWQDSCMKGANKIFNSTQTGGKNKNYTFVRGDSKYDDGLIKKAFQKVKSQTPFSSEDKWNPADIWMVSQNFDPTPLSKLNTIGEVNQFFLENFKSKDLMGISLKKITNGANIDVKNFDASAKIEKIKKYGFKKYEVKWLEGKVHPIDVYVHYGDGPKERIQFRNFSGDNEAGWQIEFKGSGAAQGKVGAGPTYKTISSVDTRNYTFDNRTLWAMCSDKAPDKTKKTIVDQIYDLMKHYKAKGLPNGKNGEIQVKSQIEQLGQGWRYSKLASLHLLEIIDKSSKSDEMMKALYLYGTSESDQSSVYIKLGN